MGKEYDTSKFETYIERSPGVPDHIYTPSQETLRRWLVGTVPRKAMDNSDPGKLAFYDFFEAEREFVVSILNKYDHSIAHIRTTERGEFVNMREALIFLKKPATKNYISFARTPAYKKYLEAFKEVQALIKRDEEVIEHNGNGKVDVKKLRTVYPVTRLEQYSNDEDGDPTPEDFIDGSLSLKVLNYSISENRAYDGSHLGQDAINYAMNYLHRELLKKRAIYPLNLLELLYLIVGLAEEAKREGLELRARSISGSRYQFTLQTPYDVKQIKLRRITFAMAKDLQNRVPAHKRRRAKTHADLWSDRNLEFGMSLPEGRFINDDDAYYHYTAAYPVPDELQLEEEESNASIFRKLDKAVQYMTDLESAGFWKKKTSEILANLQKESDQPEDPDQSEPPEQPSLFE